MTALSPLNPWLARRMALADVTPQAAARWQMAELRRTLAWALLASPFHARRLAGLAVESLQYPADLARLPRMDGTDLAEPGLLAVSQDEVERVVSLPTSGTGGGGTTGGGGPPKRLSFSEADLERTLDFFAVGMSTFTRPGDTALVLLPGRREWGVADLLARALPEIGAKAVAAPENWAPADVPGLLQGGGAAVLVAAPAQLSRLLALPAGAFRGVRAVLSSAEPLDPALRREAEGAWGCEVFDHWGMTETGYGGGVECAAHAGYHPRMADLLLEIADPGTGAPLPVGQTGEILVTTLGPRAMPLVRYRTGDAARLLPGPCPCGCPLPRLGPVAGRLGPDGTITRPEKGRRAS